MVFLILMSQQLSDAIDTAESDFTPLFNLPEW